MASTPKGSFLVVPATLAAIALIWSGNSVMSARTRTIGADRIVSFQSLPDDGADMCATEDAGDSLSSAIMAMESLPAQGAPGSGLPVCAVPPHPALGQAGSMPQHIVGGPGTGYQARTRNGQINRAPLRYIKDPYAAWSSVAVNADNDMVVLTDENLFRIVEYSRRDNTPPGAPLTEPRRVIGGDNTHTEMMCGTYIDPKTLEVYVTNNDTQDWMPVFSREARGNVKPDRLLATPHRGWGIAADETRQELFIAIQPTAVIVYRKAAAGTEAPLRVLEGVATELADPHGLALDMKNDIMIVANHGHRRIPAGPQQMMPQEEWRRAWEQAMSGNSSHNYVSLFAGGGQRGQRSRDDDDDEPGGYGRFEQPSINIYARAASGNTPPLRMIKGPKTRLNWPAHVAVHEERGEIFVANDGDDSVLVFKVSDSGDVAPQRVIRGRRANIKNPAGLAVDAKNGELWVANMGNYDVSVFPITANGDATPLRTIRGGPAGKEGLMIGNPGAVGYDRKRQEILVPN